MRNIKEIYLQFTAYFGLLLIKLSLFFTALLESLEFLVSVQTEILEMAN